MRTAFLLAALSLVAVACTENSGTSTDSSNATAAPPAPSAPVSFEKFKAEMLEASQPDGWGCQFTATENGPNLDLKVTARATATFTVTPTDEILLRSSEDRDGSYSHVFKIGDHSVRIVHVDDAYDVFMVDAAECEIDM